MDELNENSSILTPLQVVVIFVVTMLLVGILGSVIILLGGEVWGLLSEVLIIIPALFYVLYKKLPFKKTFRFNGVSPKLLLYTLLISFSIFVIGDELDRLIYLVFPMPDWLYDSMKNMLKINSLQDGIIMVLSGVVFAAFAEEMLFRGVLQQTLEHYREPAIAIVLTSILFAIIHINPWAALQITFLGMFLGYMAWKANSIIPAMILHGLNNLVSIIFINVPENSLAWYGTEKQIKPYWVLLAVIILVPSLLQFKKECENRSFNSL